ncbi:hypothetical protein AXG93_2782s1250 [Marchantia polymorpha subsp. ruderalis]|uniref:Uncharacterized protein n=1 Tax=Marchantia polymorpha subsp. ruderalis TaxID=1480154 RepID=A0A176WSF5_MARPO|nr:hypothetical protein AXG93_2782s1250 [Marchantia polymorpha subsp. ruderalis]
MSIHWACIFWSTKHRNFKDMFGGSMNILSPFFINFYRGMELLPKVEQRKFPLEREIAGSDEEVVLGGNDVVSDKDNIESTPPSTKVDKSKNDIKRQTAKKRRKLHMTSASEVVERRAGLRIMRPVPTCMKTTIMEALSSRNKRRMAFGVGPSTFEVATFRRVYGWPVGGRQK